MPQDAKRPEALAWHWAKLVYMHSPGYPTPMPWTHQGYSWAAAGADVARVTAPTEVTAIAARTSLRMLISFCARSAAVWWLDIRVPQRFTVIRPSDRRT